MLQISSHVILDKVVELKKAFSKKKTREKLLNERDRKVFLECSDPDLKKGTIFKFLVLVVVVVVFTISDSFNKFLIS